MRLRIGLVVLALFALAFGASYAGVAGAGGGGKAKVKLGDNFFKPKKKKVDAGTKVKFKWIGDNPHNVTKKRGPGRAFASETTSERGVNFKKRFRKSGKYKLICTIHPDTMRMKLKVR